MILICFALKEEAAPFRKLAANKPNVSILLTGIGRQNAEKTVRKFLAANSPKLVLTCGFAGGLNPDLKIGDMVFEMPAEIRHSQGSSLQERLISAGAKPAKFFCTDRIAITVAEKKRLHENTLADAVEMESAAIHAVCAESNIPCATIRVISDTANEDLPLDFNALAKPDKNLDMGKLFLAIAKSPGKIGELMELQKKTKFAAERLAAVLENVVIAG
jgi:adenosylhomocysteine nucleosidase